MASELRKTGISVVGDVLWGTHFCCFYETKQDLLDILVPYFKAGLEGKEFCLWIISSSELITTEEAKAALSQAVSHLDRDLVEGRIEIVSHDQWFLRGGAFDIQRVTNAFREKLDEALAKGYEGMRVNGSPAWLLSKKGRELLTFEEDLDQLISHGHSIASCTYPLEITDARFLLDVARRHQFVVVRRQGNWELLETPELKQAKQEIKRLNEELEERVRERTRELAAANDELRREIAERKRAEAAMRRSEDNLRFVIDTIPVMAWTVQPDGSVDFINQRLLDYAGLTWEQFVKEPASPIHPEDRRRVIERWHANLAATEPYEVELRLRRADGEYRWFLVRVAPLRDEQGDLVKWYGVSIDIEESKKAEALLHAREQEFRAIVENAPDLIIRYDREFRRVYVNPAVAKKYGLPAEALIGKRIGSVIRDAGLDVKENEMEEIGKKIATVFDTGKSSEYELTWPLPSGRRYYSVRLFPERDLNGVVANVLGISRDLTERRLAEEALKKEKEILEKIFANIPVMIGFVSEDGSVKLVNAEWERTIGWTLEELREQNVDLFAEAYPDPTYRQKVWDFVGAATGEWIDLKIKVRDGRVIDAACAIVQLSDGTKVAIAQDITERKQAEETLKKSETQLAEAQRLAHVGGFEWDLRTNVVTWSDELYHIFGVPPGSIQIRGDAMRFIHPEDRDLVLSTVGCAVANREPYSFHYRVLRPDGDERIVHSRGQVVSDEDGVPIRVFGASQDVTELRRAEEKLKATSEQLRALSARLQSAKEEEGARIAREIHDELGSRLTSLKWDLEDLNKILSSPVGPSQLPALGKKVEAMIDLTDATINTTRRISSELRPSVLDDLGLVAAIEWQTEQFQSRTGVVCRFESFSASDGLNHEQSTAVFRIFQEALTNVLRHARATRVDIGIREDDGEFILTVSDNGRGITEAEKSAPSSLGLLGMKERAYLVRGAIDIDRNEEGGTVITVQVPIGHDAGF
jgi:PAS domain S-box-containing protein